MSTSRLDNAKLRLERASRRLEIAARARASGAVPAETARSIEALEAENAALRTATKTMATRLDRAIARLRAELDG